MSQMYGYTEYIDMKDESLYGEMRPAPLTLRVFSFVAIFLVGAVHANNVFLSRIGPIISPERRFWHSSKRWTIT